ncbi:DegT/DnrJ/EryC1/StrS aminotransferase family protein [Thermotoga sp.]|uniref:DegT/DnrJ/EryC1/StrS family aminotransferase n=1 Tax=Thermotoga sp. TaxID=28240 RepID=UPI0025F54C6B|nr:DegT/DnrJ/EryC1/StrS aminotransferase family protein [Thermotoga sp.]MCD6550890.1 DegT/DnrJ/EryC1/StrS aminotransferase family protein [Thermotoga sp.]
MIPLSRPDITEEDIERVVEVLKSGRLSLGNYTRQFGEVVARYVGAKYGWPVSSGTAALHLILESLNVGEGDLVLVPSFTFIASVNVILMKRAIPVFVDVDRKTLNVSPETLEDAIGRCLKGFKQGDVYIKGVPQFFMAVDVFGHPLDWDGVLEICHRYGIIVMEDSCEALGSEYKGKKIGTFGMAGAFAFYPNKQITTGEGGVVVTDSEQIFSLVKSMSNQGRGEDEKWLHHVRFGYNYRIDEMSAALGCSQMKRIDEILEKRSEAANRYSRMLKGTSWVQIPAVEDYVTRMSWFVYVIRLDGPNRDRVMKYMEKRGVQVRNYFHPVHLQPFYEKTFGKMKGLLPVTEEESGKTLALPFFTRISPDEQKCVVETLREAVEKVG